MHRMFYPVLFLIVVLLVGVVWLISHPGSWWSQVSATVASVTGRSPHAKSEPPTSPEKPNPFGKKKPGPPRQSGSKPELVESAAMEPSPAPAEKHYPFPVAQDILTGTARLAILARFGPPGATVTGADVGQLRERFIYVEKPTGRKTVVFFLNGAVAFTESTP